MGDNGAIFPQDNDHAFCSAMCAPALTVGFVNYRGCNYVAWQPSCKFMPDYLIFCAHVSNYVTTFRTRR